MSDLGDQMKQAGEAMKGAAANAAGNAQTLNGKVIDQAEENVREAFKALRAAASATSIQDVLRVQTDYVKEQSTRSMSQAREIGELIAQFGRSTLSGTSSKS